MHRSEPGNSGTTGHAPIGVQLALAQARAVLDVVTRHPGRAILLLIDTQGQQLRRRDELLGINRAMAHLGMAVDFARRRGHRVLGLVYWVESEYDRSIASLTAAISLSPRDERARLALARLSTPNSQLPSPKAIAGSDLLGSSELAVGR